MKFLNPNLGLNINSEIESFEIQVLISRLELTLFNSTLNIETQNMARWYTIPNTYDLNEHQTLTKTLRREHTV